MIEDGLQVSLKITTNPKVDSLSDVTMLVLVRGDPAFTKTEVIGLDILAPRHPNLYALIVGRLGYDIDTTTNVVRYAH